MKGREAALEVGEKALALVAKNPKTVQTQAVRRAIIEALMEEFVSPMAQRNHLDPEDRRARAVIMRRLKRASREMGEPAGLRALL
jgi:hypothetical protein